MSDGLRVAIVGAGLMGRWHAHYAVRAGARIAAIVDRDPASAQALRGRHPAAAAFSEFRECLGHSRVDVAHICTRTESHPELASEALAAGIHVLVEKPVAGSVAETNRLIDLARRADLRLCPAHQFPFQRGFRRVQQGLGRLGDLVSVEFHTCTAGGSGRPPSARREVLLEILPHPLSLFRALGLSLLDGPSLCFRDDYLMVHSFPDGGPSLIITIDLRGRPTRNELTLVGTRGSAYVDLYHGLSTFDAGTVSRRAKMLRPFRDGAGLVAAAAANLVVRALRNEPAYPGLGDLIRAFYDAIRSGTPSPISDEEMLDIAGVMDRVSKADAR